MPIELISTDFDGTLHAEFENPPVPRGLELKLAELQRGGAKWVINTGRDLSSLLESLARARLSIWPDYLGLVEREIYIREGQEYHAFQPWNDQCSRDHSQLFETVRQEVPRLRSWIEQRYQATLYEDAYSPLCLIASNNPDADRIMAYLDEFCAAHPDLTVVRNDIYARFSHGRYNKGTVVAEIARQLNVPKQHIFAAGDHLNDLPMLNGQYASMVAAPGNAIPEVKKRVAASGGYVSTGAWGHGVAEALDHFLTEGG